MTFEAGRLRQPAADKRGGAILARHGPQASPLRDAHRRGCSVAAPNGVGHRLARFASTEFDLSFCRS